MNTLLAPVMLTNPETTPYFCLNKAARRIVSIIGTREWPEWLHFAPDTAMSGQVMNILNIYIDSLRPDHLSCYGYHRQTRINIDILTAQSI